MLRSTLGLVEITSKYRLRTRLRVLLPSWLGRAFPKGKGDCGAHEWYRYDESSYRCYHCAVGVRPVTEEDDRARRDQAVPPRSTENP
ncbi:hypothetical protein GCM10010193_02280 [Kitasatospora atroaurantiaca]